MKTREQRLRETVGALAAIGRRLSSSLEDEVDTFPLTPADAASDDHALTKSLDAFLQRFNQMLDHMLRKLFPRVQAAIAASDELLTVRELLENLHRASVIADVQSWLELIEVRNRLTHEYALDSIERAAALNDAWHRAPMLLDQLERTQRYILQHRLVGETGS